MNTEKATPEYLSIGFGGGGHDVGSPYYFEAQRKCQQHPTRGSGARYWYTPDASWIRPLPWILQLRAEQSNRPDATQTAHSTVYLLCASALAYFFHSESALLNPKRFALISAFSFPLLLPFTTRRLHAEAGLGRRLKSFMTDDVYRIKQCGTLAL
jgi:hypothetical protein